MDLRTWMEDKVRRNRDRTFLVFEGEEYTYGEFDRNVNRVANALAGLGVGKGDKIAIMLPNIPEHLYTWLGSVKLGAIDVPINPQFKGKLLRDVINHCDIDTIVIDEDIYDDIRGDVASVNTKIVYPGKGVGVEGEQVFSFPSLVSGASGENPPTVDMEGRDIAGFLLTSGTTGLPKACMIPHAQCIHHAEKWVEFMETSREDRFFSPLPLFHAVRLTGFLTAFAAEASFVLGRRFSSSRFWDEARETRFNVFIGHFAIPDMLLNMPERPDDRENPVEKVQAIYPRCADKFRERFGIDKIYSTHGMTEVGWPCKVVIEEGINEDLCGPPDSDFEVKIFDDKDEELPGGEVGEIVIRPKKPDIIFKGYYKEPEKTLKAFDNLWFHTGDFGYMKQGNLIFTERRSESIRRKGEFVPIDHTEDVLRSHPKVEDAAIIGVPSELEEEVKACIVLKEGERLEPEEIVDYCKENLPKFAVPRFVEFIDEVPKTPGTAKIQRYKLREKGMGKAWDSEKH